MVDAAPRLLSIGVPVRNGGELLTRALASIAAQTYEHIEVVISDNASDDGTEAQCRAFVAAHPNARYIRHDRVLSAGDNFKLVWAESRGEFFAWAAHDDDRSPDFGSALVAALVATPDAGLAYPTLLIERPDAPEPDPSPLCAGTAGLTFHERARWPWWESCLSVYGVYRRSILDGYAWHDGNGSPDVPLLSYVAVNSEIIHVSDPTLTYRLVTRRSDQLAGAGRFRVARINWAAAKAAVDADADRRGRRRTALPVFLRLETAHVARRVAQIARRGRRWEPLIGASR